MLSSIIIKCIPLSKQGKCIKAYANYIKRLNYTKKKKDIGLPIGMIFNNPWAWASSWLINMEKESMDSANHAFYR